MSESEPCKMFSVVLPFSVYERLKAMAREGETSIGGLLREGASRVLKGKASDGQNKNTK